MSIAWPYARLTSYDNTKRPKATDLNTLQDVLVDQNKIPLRLVDDFLDGVGFAPSGVAPGRYTDNSGGSDTALIYDDHAAYGFGALQISSVGGAVHVLTKAPCGIDTQDFRIVFRVRVAAFDITSISFIGIGNAVSPDATYRGFYIKYPDADSTHAVWQPLVTGVPFDPLRFVKPTSIYQVLEINRTSGELNFLVDNIHICTVKDATSFKALKFIFYGLSNISFNVDWYGFGF